MKTKFGAYFQVNYLISDEDKKDIKSFLQNRINSLEIKEITMDEKDGIIKATIVSNMKHLIPGKDYKGTIKEEDKSFELKIDSINKCLNGLTDIIEMIISKNQIIEEWLEKQSNEETSKKEQDEKFKRNEIKESFSEYTQTLTVRVNEISKILEEINEKENIFKTFIHDKSALIGGLETSLKLSGSWHQIQNGHIFFKKQ